MNHAPVRWCSARGVTGSRKTLPSSRHPEPGQSQSDHAFRPVLTVSILLAAVGATGVAALLVRWWQHHGDGISGPVATVASNDPSASATLTAIPWLTAAIFGAAVLAALVLLGFRYLRTYHFASEFAKRATKVAEFNQTRLLDFVEQSSDWLWETDREHHFTLISSGIRSVANMAPDALVGQAPWELPGDETDANTWRNLKLRMAGHQNISVLISRRDLSDEVRHLEFIGKPLFDGELFIGYRGIGRDITQRIDAERDLRTSESRFRTLIETFFDWYWEQDAQFRFTRVLTSPNNPIQLGESETLGQTRWQLVGASETAPEWAEHIATLHAHEPFDNFIYQRTLPNGRRVWFSITGRPIFDSSGRFSGYRGVTRDVTQEHETRHALVESEARYRTTFEQAPVGITNANPEGCIESANHAFAQMLGGDPASLIGRSLKELTHPADRDEDIKFFSALKDGRIDAYTREKRFVHLSGQDVWATVAVSALRDEAGDLRTCIGITQDITARVHAERQRHAVEERYRRLVDVSPDGIIVHRDARIIFGNRAALTIFGIDDIKDLIGEPLDRFYVDTTNPLTVPTEAIHGAQLPIRHRQIMQPGGGCRDVEITSVVTQFDDGPAILSLVRDVSDRNAAQLALQQSRTRYKEVVDSINEVIFQTDLNGCFIFLNPAWTRTTGFPVEDSIGQPLTDYVHPDDRNFGRVKLEAVLAALDKECECELRIRNMAGELRWLEVHARPVYDELGAVTGATGSLDDITERKVAELTLRNVNMELEARVRARTAELETSNRELEAFSYSVSHDLRAPLRAIDGFSVILQEDLDPQLDNTARTYLQRIRTATGRMAQLIDDLIELARLTRQPLRRNNIDLSQMVTDVINEIRITDPDRTLVTDIVPGLTANADPTLMRVVVENLVRNAWKFSKGKPVSRISFFATRTDDEVQFCVEDNGVGFAMEYASKLFVPFHRLHPNSQFEGSGIGLATVQRIIARHGGKISAHSVPGEGARFSFSIGH